MDKQHPPKFKKSSSNIPSNINNNFNLQHIITSSSISPKQFKKEKDDTIGTNTIQSKFQFNPKTKNLKTKNSSNLFNIITNKSKNVSYSPAYDKQANNKFALNFSSLFQMNDNTLTIPINKNFEKFYQELFTNFTKCNVVKTVEDISDKFHLFSDKTNRWVLYDLILMCYSKFLRKKIYKLKKMFSSVTEKMILISFTKMQESIVSWTKELSKIPYNDSLNSNLSNKLDKLLEFNSLRDNKRVKDSYDMYNYKFVRKDSLEEQYSSLDSNRDDSINYNYNYNINSINNLNSNLKANNNLNLNPSSSHNNKDYYRDSTLLSNELNRGRSRENSTSKLFNRTYTSVSGFMNTKTSKNELLLKRVYNIQEETYTYQKERLLFFNLNLIYFTALYYYSLNCLQECHAVLISSIPILEDFIDFQKSITEVFKRKSEVFPKCLPDTYSVISEIFTLLSTVLIYYKNYVSAFYYSDMSLRFSNKEMLYRESNFDCNIYYNSDSIYYTNNNANNANNNLTNVNPNSFFYTITPFYLINENIKNQNLMYLNIVTSLYQRGVCYENFGNTSEEHLKAIENYKQSCWFAANFLKQSNPIVSQYIFDVQSSMISKYLYCKDLFSNNKGLIKSKRKKFDKIAYMFSDDRNNNQKSFHDKLVDEKMQNSELKIKFIEKMKYNEAVENPLQYIEVLNSYQNNNNDVQVIGTFDLVNSYKVKNKPMINKYKNYVNTVKEVQNNDFSNFNSNNNITNNNSKSVSSKRLINALSSDKSHKSVSNINSNKKSNSNFNENNERTTEPNQEQITEANTELPFFYSLDQCLEQYNKNNLGFGININSNINKINNNTRESNLIYYQPKVNHSKIKNFVLSSYNLIKKLASKQYSRFLHSLSNKQLQLFKFDKNFQDRICNEIIRENYLKKQKLRRKIQEKLNRRIKKADKDRLKKMSNKLLNTRKEMIPFFESEELQKMSNKLKNKDSFGNFDNLVSNFSGFNNFNKLPGDGFVRRCNKLAVQTHRETLIKNIDKTKINELRAIEEETIGNGYGNTLTGRESNSGGNTLRESNGYCYNNSTNNIGTSNLNNNSSTNLFNKFSSRTKMSRFSKVGLDSIPYNSCYNLLRNTNIKQTVKLTSNNFMTTMANKKDIKKENAMRKETKFRKSRTIQVNDYELFEFDHEAIPGTIDEECIARYAKSKRDKEIQNDEQDANDSCVYNIYNHENDDSVKNFNVSKKDDNTSNNDKDKDNSDNLSIKSSHSSNASVKIRKKKQIVIIDIKKRKKIKYEEEAPNRRVSKTNNIYNKKRISNNILYTSINISDINEEVGKENNNSSMSKIKNENSDSDDDFKISNNGNNSKKHRKNDTDKNNKHLSTNNLNEVNHSIRTKIIENSKSSCSSNKNNNPDSNYSFIHNYNNKVINIQENNSNQATTLDSQQSSVNKNNELIKKKIEDYLKKKNNDNNKNNKTVFNNHLQYSKNNNDNSKIKIVMSSNLEDISNNSNSMGNRNNNTRNNKNIIDTENINTVVSNINTCSTVFTNNNNNIITNTNNTANTKENDFDSFNKNNKSGISNKTNNTASLNPIRLCINNKIINNVDKNNINYRNRPQSNYQLIDTTNNTNNDDNNTNTNNNFSNTNTFNHMKNKDSNLNIFATTNTNTSTNKNTIDGTKSYKSSFIPAFPNINSTSNSNIHSKMQSYNNISDINNDNMNDQSTQVKINNNNGIESKFKKTKMSKIAIQAKAKRGSITSRNSDSLVFNNNIMFGSKINSNTGNNDGINNFKTISNEENMIYNNSSNKNINNKNQKLFSIQSKKFYLDKSANKDNKKNNNEVESKIVNNSASFNNNNKNIIQPKCQEVQYTSQKSNIYINNTNNTNNTNLNNPTTQEFESKPSNINILDLPLTDRNINTKRPITSLTFNRNYKKKLDYVNYFENKELNFQKELLQIKAQENFISYKYDSSTTRKECERFFVTNYMKSKSKLKPTSNLEALLSKNKLNHYKEEQLKMSVVHSIDNKALSNYYNYINENKKRDLNKIRKEFQVKKEKEIDIDRVHNDKTKQIDNISSCMDSIVKNIINFDPLKKKLKLDSKNKYIENINKRKTVFHKKTKKHHNKDNGENGENGNKKFVNFSVGEESQEYIDIEEDDKDYDSIKKIKVDGNNELFEYKYNANHDEESYSNENDDVNEEDLSKKKSKINRNNENKENKMEVIFTKKKFNIFDYARDGEYNFNRDDDHVVFRFS